MTNTTMSAQQEINTPSAVLRGVFYRDDPQGKPSPLVVDVSRSGREYPHDFRSPVALTTVHDNISMYVDEIYAEAPKLGGTLLYACFPNMYIDTNRSARDIDPSLIDGEWPGPIESSDFTQRGLGLLKRLSRYGEPFQERKLTVAEVQSRLDRFHEPYHQELSRVIQETREKQGYAVQLSCHCMSAVGAPTHADPGQARADFNLGDCHGTTSSKETIDFLERTLKDLGHTVSINFPYYGGDLIRRHSNPKAGIDSIFVEVNKRLFIDTKTFLKTDGFEAVKQSATSMMKALVEYARSKT
ncbi:N-formylglutamate deformylase [Achromobacter xylosoxidans]|uniref:N-formylglutamate amidohydrolase n=1 Tax=Alcaligenes xylosoxydans xylosoxydans TaxID=85698 RepID=UPI0012AA367D|nr:N-formylglutamate amidohydrolase [Achromobacter xylosoxidans]CUR72887.1 N-formylglutamate deformylase [Achromobacter xylosoxidans]